MNLEPVRSLWVGDALPAAQAGCIASFLRVGHPFELFVYVPVAGVPSGVHVRRADDIVPQKSVFTYSAASGRAQGGLSGFSNLFRYALLAREGGWWVDTDSFCLRPLPEDEVVIGSERRRDGAAIPTSGVIRCPPGHALARYCLEQSANVDTETMTFGETGPALVAAAVQELGLQVSVASPDAFCCVDWFDFETLLVPGAPSADAITIHLWGEMWRRRDRAIPWPGPEGSMLAHMAAMLGRRVLSAESRTRSAPNQNATR